MDNMKAKAYLLALALCLDAVMNGVAQPVITCQPSNQTAVAGSPVTFTVCATGAPPLSYQWIFNTLSNRLPGATSETLILPNVQASNAGIYRVIVTNAAGSIQSGSARLTVLIPPAITNQPSDFPVLSLGASVTNRVGASGTPPLSYQWRRNGTNLPGQTNAVLVLTNLQMSSPGDYLVQITNTAGSTDSRVVTLSVDPTFTKIITGLMVTRAGSSRGAAWGDYDGDGFIDLYVSNSAADGATDGRDYLFHNNRNGMFTEVRAAAGIADPDDSQACTWIDYDNDGLPDLFVSAYFDNLNKLYHNRGNGTFSAVSGGPIPLGGSNATAAAWADIDNDGQVDLFVADSLFATTPRRDLYYRNVGGGVFQQLTNILVNELRYGRGAAWGDYDNDGRPDLFVAVSDAVTTNRLFHNAGGGAFTSGAGAGPEETTSYSISGSWADYDNDGNLDLFVANGGWEAVLGNFLYRNRGDGTLERVLEGPIVTDRFGSVYGAWGDYDNDGFPDLFVCHSSLSSDGYPPNVRNSLYHNNGDGTFTSINTGSMVVDLGISLGAAWGDYDNDGFLDLYVTNFGSRVNDLFHNNGNSNAWLIVRCIGTVSNRSAIGAKVRVKAAVRGRTMWQLREIGTCGGYTSQNDQRAHFGLGDATNIQTLRIEWPSGTVQELTNVAPRQILIVTEPPRLTATRISSQLQFLLQGGRNMAYDIQSSTNLNDWTLASAVTITNLAGTATISIALPVDGPQKFYRSVLR